MTAQQFGYVNNEYENLLRQILNTGSKKEDRTGTGAISLFGPQLRYNLSKGFPLITTKKVHMKSIIAELLWMLSGSTNVKDLQAMDCTIWDEWQREDGSIGPGYGHQWRSWTTPDGGSIDQITQVIQSILNNPYSRRHIVSAWNVADLPNMALPPCHAFFQFNVRETSVADRKRWHMRNGTDFQVHDLSLDCKLYQRSADMFLGVPFNIASYALLTHMVAQQVGMTPGDFIWTAGDAHIYDNHVQQVETQLTRKAYQFPSLKLENRKTIFDYKPGDIEIIGYSHHPAIKGEVAV